MKKYIFLENSESHVKTYNAVLTSRVKNVPYADCYNGFGEIIDHDGAGDYLVIGENKETLNTIIKYMSDNEFEQYDIEKIKPGNYIAASAEMYNDETVAYYNLFVFAMDLPDISLEQQYVDAIIYWNGYNWASEVVNWGVLEGNTSVVTDQKLIRQLTAAIASWQRFHKVGNYGAKVMRGKKWRVSTCPFQGDFADLYIQEL